MIGNALNYVNFKYGDVINKSHGCGHLMWNALIIINDNTWSVIDEKVKVCNYTGFCYITGYLSRSWIPSNIVCKIWSLYYKNWILGRWNYISIICIFWSIICGYIIENWIFYH